MSIYPFHNYKNEIIFILCKQIPLNKYARILAWGIKSVPYAM